MPSAEAEAAEALVAIERSSARAQSPKVHQLAASAHADEAKTSDVANRPSASSVARWLSSRGEYLRRPAAETRLRGARLGVALERREGREAVIRRRAMRRQARQWRAVIRRRASPLHHDEPKHGAAGVALAAGVAQVVTDRHAVVLV